MKYAVLLHGCGVFDGTEIHEAVFTLLEIARQGHQYQCFAPDTKQHHVVNHLNGEEQNEERNVLVESARIARGDIKPLADLKAEEYDGLFMPGGFGTAKNITKWAFSGPDGEISEEAKNVIIDFVSNKKVIGAFCMSPTTIAKALEGTQFSARLSVGTDKEKSPYDISAISAGMNAIGAQTEMKSVREIGFDSKLKIVSAPCYMMEASITEVYENIKMAIEKITKL